MKLNKFFLMFAIGLGLFACSENELEGNGPEGVQNEGTTYVGFSLKFNDANTRADVESATEEESNITSAYVMMTSKGGTTFEKVLSFTNPVTKEEGYYQEYEKFLFQTTAGNHDFMQLLIQMLLR